MSAAEAALVTDAAAAAAAADPGHSFISQSQNPYRLEGGSRCREGRYRCDNGELFDEAGNVVGNSTELFDEAGDVVGVFTCDPIGCEPLTSDLLDGPADAELPIISVFTGEIMEAIQDPEHSGAFFVLPSQLNGAEYPSDDWIVSKIQLYTGDNTGGPRGQLAVHPAPGQFVLDNAANARRPNGINAIDQVLRVTKQNGFDFELKNGYLSMPMPSSESAAEEMLSCFRSQLHTLRPLIMSNIPACGLLPSKHGLSDAMHRVGLVYASAVPVDSYMNRADPRTPAGKLHRKVAEGILVAQYYGAMSQIARRTASGSRTTVFLMPLGGGVFNNPTESIARAMSIAVEMLERDGLVSMLDIRVLAWRGNWREASTFARLLKDLNKLDADATAPEAMSAPGLRCM